MSVSKEELLRLAKKAWPLPDEYGGHDDMAVSMTGPTVRVYHPYEDDAGGFFVIHPSLAKEAAHAALLVLAGEDDRERLRAENAALRKQLAARERALLHAVFAMQVWGSWEDGRASKVLLEEAEALKGGKNG